MAVEHCKFDHPYTLRFEVRWQVKAPRSVRNSAYQKGPQQICTNQSIASQLGTFKALLVHAEAILYSIRVVSSTCIRYTCVYFHGIRT